MNKIKLALATLVAVVAVGCSSDEPAGSAADNTYERINLSRGEAQVAEAGYGFAWNLFDKVNAEQAGKNVCLSPLSANIALTMLLNGAEGETSDEIVSALGLEGMSVDEINENSRFLVSELLNRDKDCSLYVANSLWINDGVTIRRDFKDTLKEYYAAMVQSTNSTTFAKDVNAWCSKQTKGLISNLVKEGESYDLALLNAIYFQNLWSKTVKFEGAGQKEFKNYDGSSVMKAFMKGDIPCYYGETASARHAHISFGNGAYRMSVSLPHEDANIEQCIDELKDPKAFSDISRVKLDLTMPKFEFKNECDLNETLKLLGIESAFDPKDAKFPYITDSYEYKQFLSTVKQSCCIKVDEKGAIAAAVTMGGMTGMSPGALERPEPMVVDRPFIFTIYEQSTGCILFMGKIERF